jgi:uncharacterized lipoprotein YehR (DUF1307 family)
MRFHWLHRGEFDSVKKIKKFSAKLEENNYYSVLLTYHSKSKDLLLKSFASASNKQKLKYMVAIRTYAITPEYLSMICKSYNEEFPNKLILNIVSGDLHSEESSIEDLPDFSEHLNTVEKRINYTKKWMQKFKELSVEYFPEIIMGGHSDLTKQICKDFNGTHLCMAKSYKEDLLRKDRIVNSKQMVTFAVVIRDTLEEAEKFIIKNAQGGEPLRWTIYGPKESVKAEIKQFYDLGITDIMISSTNKDKNVDAIHEVVKELILEEKI